MVHRNRPAFSITSLLTLLALFLLLLGMLIPVIARLRQSAGAQQSLNNMRQMAIAVHAFHDVHGALPPALGKSGLGSGTLHVQMLPFLEQEPLFRQAKDNWLAVADRVIPLYLDPEDKTAPTGNLFQGGFATTNYAGNWLFFGNGGMTIANITDGLSNTVMITTRYQQCNGEPTAWAYNRLHYKAPMYAFYSRARFQVLPSDADCDPALPQALSNRGILAAMGDGSARTVSTMCSPQTWSHATDPADNQATGDDF